jgi:apolipoprotein D and lipocalin family protein
MKLYLLGLLALVLVGQGQAQAEDELQTVPYVDVKSYMGKWYEIASIPQIFATGCVGSTADYSLLKTGEVLVYNSCWLHSFEGRRNSAVGRARVADPETNSKLIVRFPRNPFEGKYWIIELDKDYQYAVVGHPSRDYAWILSRTPQMDPGILEELMTRLEFRHGYDVSRLEMTPQR